MRVHAIPSAARCEPPGEYGFPAADTNALPAPAPEGAMRKSRAIRWISTVRAARSRGPWVTSTARRRPIERTGMDDRGAGRSRQPDPLDRWCTVVFICGSLFVRQANAGRPGSHHPIAATAYSLHPHDHHFERRCLQRTRTSVTAQPACRDPGNRVSSSVPVGATRPEADDPQQCKQTSRSLVSRGRFLGSGLPAAR